MKSDFFSVSYHSLTSLGVDWPERYVTDGIKKKEKKDRSQMQTGTFGNMEEMLGETDTKS